MALDRFNVALDPIDSRGVAMRDASYAQRDAAQANLVDAPAPPPAEPTPPPTEPAPKPGGGGGQGGSAPTPPPAPAAAVPPPGPHGNSNYAPTPGQDTAIQGVQGSQATGGVQGSFSQAGTADFANRFGNQDNAPATWFRRNASQAPGAPGSQSRDAMTRGGGSTGGGAPLTEPAAAGDPLTGGTPQDEEWQRFMQAVLAQRFRQ